MNNSYQSKLGFGTPAFWSFMLTMIPATVLYTWIYNSTHRSTLSAVLFHFVINFAGELLPRSPSAEWYNLALFAIIAAVITATWRPKTLSRHDTLSVSAP